MIDPPPSTGQSRLPRSAVVIAPAAVRRAAGFGFAAGALQRFDPVVQRVFVALKTREPLLRLLRAAARLAQVGLPRVLERR